MLRDLARIRNRKTGRASPWNTTGRNNDAWMFEPGQTRVLADIDGPGLITHIWMTQGQGYRECLLKITWDDAKHPSVVCPLGDFFGLGHSIVHSYESLLFSSSVNGNWENQFNRWTALNCYVQMPFGQHARVELENQSGEPHRQFFYVDYETGDVDQEEGYFHTEWRRTNPFGGWGHEIIVNTPEGNIVNQKRTAWENNYVILEAKGRGHYIGCNMSVTNFQGSWWGEGDEMIWVDGYKWPPDVHGTGSEDYFNQAQGMQDNAFLRCGSSVFERNSPSSAQMVYPWRGSAGYQTSYVHHIENPVRFTKEIKVSMEHGHGNHLRNEMSSTAYWYVDRPCRVKAPPPVAKRLPVLQDNQGNWLYDKRNQCPGKDIEPNAEMKRMKKAWAGKHR